ncbi:hypothetical protein M9H77_12397 [Catharanthus roseus]|uniref:Uncharacterized protein n=1 Tax=Catharanthus roseus TaxID=4058 RepID=A0ACC0BHF2_CATRO|nr:hypothetical protein M9H77_12397 [Catharanthus roseus]
MASSDATCHHFRKHKIKDTCLLYEIPLATLTRGILVIIPFYTILFWEDPANLEKSTAQPESEFPFKAIYLLISRKLGFGNGLNLIKIRLLQLKRKIMKLKGQRYLISIVPSSLEVLEKLKESI